MQLKIQKNLLICYAFQIMNHSHLLPVNSYCTSSYFGRLIRPLISPHSYVNHLQQKLKSHHASHKVLVI